MSIITSGYGDDQRIILQGYGEVVIVITPPAPAPRIARRIRAPIYTHPTKDIFYLKGDLLIHIEYYITLLGDLIVKLHVPVSLKGTLLKKLRRVIPIKADLTYGYSAVFNLKGDTITELLSILNIKGEKDFKKLILEIILDDDE